MSPHITGYVLGEQRLGEAQALWTVRLVFDPGSGLPYWTPGGATVVAVETGLIGYTAVSGRSRMVTDPEGAASALAAIGVEYFLAARSTISIGPAVEHCLRNAGEALAAVLVTTVGSRERLPFGRAISTEGRPVRFPVAGETS